MEDLEVVAAEQAVEIKRLDMVGLVQMVAHHIREVDRLTKILLAVQQRDKMTIGMHQAGPLVLQIVAAVAAAVTDTAVVMVHQEVPEYRVLKVAPVAEAVVTLRQVALGAALAAPAWL
jgi:hypothetical protein